MNVSEIPIRNVSFNLAASYSEEHGIPLVGLSISHPNEDTGALEEAHVVVLHSEDAANLGNSLLRLASGSTFYAAIENYIALREEAGDGVATSVLRDFQVWFSEVDRARAEDASEAELERMGAQRAAYGDG